ncbi:hypothetical protein [Nocardia sp. NPDC050793]|uniref:hypothetical protein n=1 Tax=Nocardia sp. NPDC050793 TaxID=3155159 RepID=UPI003401A0D1
MRHKGVQFVGTQQGGVGLLPGRPVARCLRSVEGRYIDIPADLHRVVITCVELVLP